MGDLLNFFCRKVIVKVIENKINLKADYFMKVGLLDLGTLGGKIKFEFCRPALRCLDGQNSNLIFLP